jgi:hypothetical protein
MNWRKTLAYEEASYKTRANHNFAALSEFQTCNSLSRDSALCAGL